MELYFLSQKYYLMLNKVFLIIILMKTALCKLVSILSTYGLYWYEIVIKVILLLIVVQNLCI